MRMKKSNLLCLLAIAGLAASCDQDPDSVNAKLSVPQHFRVDEQTIAQTSVRLQWDAAASDAVAGYTVAYAPVDRSNFYEKECFETETIVTGLRLETEYRFKIRANAFGAVENNSDWSPEITVTTLAPALPDMPAGLRTVLDAVSSTRIAVAWDPVPGASDYLLSYKRETDEAFVTLETEATEAVIGLLDVETAYVFRVRARSPIGLSESTPELKISTRARSEGLFYPEDLIAFAQGPANGGQWKNPTGEVVLRRDIDMTGSGWTPMPEFTGTLDGGGKTISNLVCKAGEERVGMIAVLKGTIRNLTLGTGCLFESTRTTAPESAESGTKIGAFAAVAQEGGLESCTSMATVSAGPGSESVGGLLGLARSGSETVSLRIEGCTHAGTVSVSGNIPCTRSGQFIDLGGIAGSVEAGVAITGCTNRGSVSCENSASAAQARLSMRIGGIAGYASDAAINACNNESQARIGIGGNPHYARVGGIVGYARGVAFTDCVNRGEFALTSAPDPTSEYETGGIVGRAENGTGTQRIEMRGCRNSSDLTVEARVEANKPVTVAGIAGFLKMGSVPFEIADCHNDADLHATATTSTSQLGGIAGCIEAQAEGTVSGCTNSGKLTSVLTSNKAFHVGGIVGVNKSATTTVKQCSNTGDLDINNTQKAYGGGIVGEAQGCTVEACTNSGHVQALFNALDVTHIGGIVARTYRGATIRGCTNSGRIVYGGTNPKIGADRTGGFGGIVGYLDKSNATVDGCTNTGTILGDAAGEGRKGAICGWASADGPTAIRNCVVQGAVGTYDPAADDLGVSAAEVLTPENYSRYIYGGRIAANALEEADNVFTK